MGFREVSVVEVREVLRAWLEGHGLRTVASRAGVDRKTARRYVAAAEAAGLILAGDSLREPNLDSSRRYVSLVRNTQYVLFVGAGSRGLRKHYGVCQRHGGNEDRQQRRQYLRAHSVSHSRVFHGAFSVVDGIAACGAGGVGS